MTSERLRDPHPHALDRPAPVLPVGAPRVPSTDLPARSDWGQYVHAVRRHRWLVIGLTLGGTLLGVLLAGRIEPQYAARAVIWIENSDVDAVGRTGSGRLLDPASWMELLTSHTVLDSVIRTLRLHVTPQSAAAATRLRAFDVDAQAAAGEYTLAVARDGARYTLTRGDLVVEQGAVGDSIGRRLGFRWAPSPDQLAPGTLTAFTLTSPVDAMAALARGLRGTVDAGGAFLRLELRGPDPARTSATLNAVAERGVAVAAALKRQRLEELDRILGGQHEHAEQELRAVERELADFRVRGIRRLETAPNGAAPAGDGELAAVAVLGATRDQLRRDRERLQELLAGAGEEGISLEALGAVPAVAESAPLRAAIEEATRRGAEHRALRYRYSDASAPVIEARAALAALTTQSIPSLTRQLVADLEARERVLGPRVDSAFGRLRESPSLAIAEARLQRRLEAAEGIVRSVGERLEANRLALLSSLPDLHLLDPAMTPQTPAMDLGPLVVLLAFATSLGVSVLGVRMRDHVDSRIRRPEQVTHLLQLPILACLPRVGRSRFTTEGDAGAEVIEALRGLRLRLLHTRSVGAISLTITSPACGDGKSFLSSNLAVSFALAGYRTLLVDGDARRGVQHRVLGCSPRPGLVDVLAGEVPVLDAVQETRHPNLDLLTAGTRSARAPELMMGAQLAAAMSSLKATYDVLVVDSPPLSAGVDALVLGAATENLLVVLRSGRTELPLTLAKLEVAGSHPVHLLGAVLNDVRGQGEFRDYAYDLTGYRLREDLVAAGAEGPAVLGGRT